MTTLELSSSALLKTLAMATVRRRVWTTLFRAVAGFVVWSATACSSSSGDAGAPAGPGADAGAKPGPDTDARAADAPNEADALIEAARPSSSAEKLECPEDQTVQQGSNVGWKAGGRARSFYADLPKNAGSTPIALVFSWHGVGDNVDNWRRVFSPDPDGDPEFPLAIITPEDLKLQPFSTPKGLGWDLLLSATGDKNLEAALFESIIGCLRKQRTIDLARIYSVGFSAGAIVTNMLHSRYPDIVATSVAWSGVWLNDPKERELVTLPKGLTVAFEWAAPGPVAGGAQLLTHGGPNDTYSTFGTRIIDFDAAAKEAVPFLTAAGRALIDCEHDRGHRLHPKVGPREALAFLKAHRAGEKSPFVGAVPSFLAEASCTAYAPAAR